MFSLYEISKYHSLTPQFKIPLQHKCIKIYLLSFTKFHFFGLEKESSFQNVEVFSPSFFLGSALCYTSPSWMQDLHGSGLIHIFFK